MATSIRLEESFEARITRLATLTDRPKSFYIRKLFEDYFENLEDYYLAEKQILHLSEFILQMKWSKNLILQVARKNNDKRTFRFDL